MTSRERLMAILNREKEVDRVAWSPLIDGYFMSSFPPGTDIINILKEIKADAMLRHFYTWEGNIEKHNIEESESRGNLMKTVKTNINNTIKISRKETVEKKGILRKIEYEIPGYILRSRFLFTEESPYIPFPIEPLIKTPEDLEAFEYLKKNEKYESNYSNFIREDKRIGDLGIVTDTGFASPIQELIQVLIGIEKFYTIFFTDSLDKLTSLINVMHEKNLECYKIIADSPSHVVINYENTSTTLISPEIYKNYCLPYINDYANILHKKNKIYLTHRCGKLNRLLNLLKLGKEDGIIDISPAPTGDLNIWDAQEALPDKILMGGIDPTFLTQWFPNQIKDYVRAILAKVKNKNNIIIGTADATPKDAKIENLKAIGDILAEYK